MSHQFKPGDLALIVNSKITENIGRVVELVRRTDENIIKTPDGGVFANPDRLACWVVAGDSLKATRVLDGTESFNSFGAAAERNLMPLRGDFQPERQKSQEVPA